MKNTNILNQTVATPDTIANLLNVYYYRDEIKVYYGGMRVNAIKLVLNKKRDTTDMFLTLANDNIDDCIEMPVPLFDRLSNKERIELTIFILLSRASKEHYETLEEDIEIFYFAWN